MTKAIGELDRLLRGETTKVEKLKRGVLDVDASGLAVVILVLGLFYGACMGSFGIAQKGIAAVPQLIATTGKVPLLFLLTLIVTFPSLYVFNALVGSRLTLASTLRLIVAAMAIMLAVLSSLGTIVAFFSVSTNDYYFMLLLNVLVFSVSGLLGMKFLLHTLHRLTVVQDAEDFAAQGNRSAAAIRTPTTIATRRVRQNERSRHWLQRHDDFSHLDCGFWFSRRANGLGFATIHRRATQEFSPCFANAIPTSSRPF